MTLPFDVLRLLRARLETAAWLAPQLELAITRQTQIGDPYQEGGKSTETPLMFDDEASEAAWVLRQTLLAWAGEAERPGDRIMLDADGTATARLANWLHDRVTRFDDPSVLEEVTVAVDLGLKVIDQPVCRIYLGDCVCGSRLYGDPEQHEVRCGRCETSYDPKQRREANIGRAQDYPITATDAARYLGEVCGITMNANRIHLWASRKKLTAIGANQDGRPVYRLGDVLELARTSANRV